MPKSIESSHRAWPLLTLALLAALLWFGERMQAAPTARTDAVPASEFSAQRAQAHVAVIARQPHPSGSAANAQVRDYLLTTLRGLGAEVELQRRLQTYQHTPRAGQARFAVVENIVARWPGTRPGKALLLMAHYDSVPSGPGAGDDASGVATVLETVRALTADGLPMRNDLLLLFSDGEELGLLGAQAFFGEHRWAGQVGMVLNFDARGSRGPVYMYETSARNGALIEALGQVVSTPTANSLVYGVFQHMPNHSDLSIAKAAGIAGMNFAFVDGFSDYHGPTDTVQRLSLDSLQHLGSYALPLAKHFGAVELPLRIGANRHYFNPLGHAFVSYPPWLDWLLWGLAAGLLSFASLRALRRRACRWPELLRGVGSAALLIAVPVLLVLLLDRLLDQAVGLPNVMARQRVWFGAWALLAVGVAVGLQVAVRTGLGWRFGLSLIVLLSGLGWASGAGWILQAVVLALGVGLALTLRRPLSHEAWIAGCGWLLLLLALAALLFLAGGAHVLLWPLLALTLVQAWRWHRGDGRATPLAWLLAGLPAALLLGAAALTFELMIGFALPMVSVLPLLLVLLFFAPLIGQRSARASGFGLAVLGAAGLAWLTLSPPWSEEHPQPGALFVLHDGDQQRSYWASNDRQLSDWHRLALGSKPQTGDSALYRPDAAEPLWMTPLAKPVVTAPMSDVLLADAEQRRLRLRVRPGQAGDAMTLWLPPGTDLRAWQVDGQRLQWNPADRDRWHSLSGFALPAAGVELTLDFGPGEHWPALRLVAVHHGLPAGLALPARGPTRKRSAYAYADATVTVQQLSIASP